MTWTMSPNKCPYRHSPGHARSQRIFIDLTNWLTFALISLFIISTSPSTDPTAVANCFIELMARISMRIAWWEAKPPFVWLIFGLEPAPRHALNCRLNQIRGVRQHLSIKLAPAARFCFVPLWFAVSCVKFLSESNLIYSAWRAYNAC